MHYTKFIIIGAATLAFLPAAAMAQDRGFFFALGAGVEYGPEYQGSDEYEVSPIPFVELGYNFGNQWNSSIGFAGDGVELTIYSDERLAFGAGIGYGGGRESEDIAILGGLPDIDDGVTVSAFASYAPVDYLSLDFGITKFTDGTEGLEASFAVSTGIPLTDRLDVGLSLGTTYMDDDAAQGFFGVTAAQSAASTAGLTPFNASGGLTSVDLSIDFGYAFTDTVTGVASIGVSKLIGDAKDSPFTKDDVNPSLSLGVIYEF